MIHSLILDDHHIVLKSKQRKVTGQNGKPWIAGCAFVGNLEPVRAILNNIKQSHLCHHVSAVP